MPSHLPLDEAYLTAIWLETLLYGEHLLIHPSYYSFSIRHCVESILHIPPGINVSLFFIYLYIARYKRRSPRLSHPLLLSAIAMILFSTAHVSLGLRRLLEGFIYLEGGPEPDGPAAYFSNVSLPVNVAKVVVHTVNSIVGDGIVVSTLNLWN